MHGLCHDWPAAGLRASVRFVPPSPESYRSAEQSRPGRSGVCLLLVEAASMTSARSSPQPTTG
jgi:hypothetical protein